MSQRVERATLRRSSLRVRPFFKATVHEGDLPSAIPKVRDLFIMAFPGFDPFGSPQFWPDFRDSFSKRQTENDLVEGQLRSIHPIGINSQ